MLPTTAENGKITIIYYADICNKSHLETLICRKISNVLMSPCCFLTKLQFTVFKLLLNTQSVQKKFAIMNFLRKLKHLHQNYSKDFQCL